MRSPKRTRTDADIKVAARAWANPATRAAAEITNSHISDWETSQVTNMEKLFYGGNTSYRGDYNIESFNDEISRWDKSNVTTIDHTQIDIETNKIKDFAIGFRQKSVLKSVKMTCLVDLVQISNKIQCTRM
jgi:hypothetical protein